MSLSSLISSWQAGGSLINVAGKRSADWVHTTAFGKGTAETYRTFISPTFAVMQNTNIKSFKYYTKNFAGNPAGTWKFKIFRYYNSTWNIVHDVSLGTPSLGLNTATVDLSVQIGDVLGLMLPGTTEQYNQISASDYSRELPTRYVDLDVTTSDAFATTNTVDLNIEALGYRPFLVVVGDSRVCGNGGNYSTQEYNSASFASNPGGLDIDYSPMHHLEGLVSGLQTQNFSRGSQTFAWGLSTGVPHALTVDPCVVLIAFGVNDVSAGRTWASVESDLDSILTLCAGKDLFISEILPWTAGNDTQAATIRTFNANLATWCAENGATLIECHDAMGETRPSTGGLDDMAAAYNNADNVHLTTDGAAAYADLIYDALVGIYPSNTSFYAYAQQ